MTSYYLIILTFRFIDSSRTRVYNLTEDIITCHIIYHTTHSNLHSKKKGYLKDEKEGWKVQVPLLVYSRMYFMKNLKIYVTIIP